MPKIDINGVVREMTMAEFNAYMPPQTLTADERLEEIEAALLELAEIIGGME